MIRREDVDQVARVQMSYLNEVGLECQDEGSEESEIRRVAFPGYAPFGIGSPTVLVDEEGEVGVAAT